MKRTEQRPEPQPTPRNRDSVSAGVDNPRALLAWRLAVWGLIPVAGLVLGPAAALMALTAYRRGQSDPVASGNGHALAALALGGLEGLTNLVGGLLVVRGVGG